MTSTWQTEFDDMEVLQNYGSPKLPLSCASWPFRAPQCLVYQADIYRERHSQVDKRPPPSGPRHNPGVRAAQWHRRLGAVAPRCDRVEGAIFLGLFWSGHPAVETNPTTLGGSICSSVFEGTHWVRSYQGSLDEDDVCRPSHWYWSGWDQVFNPTFS